MKYRTYILILFVLVVIANVVLGYMGSKLGAESQGLTPLEVRIAGYTVEEAQQYLDVLTPRGVELLLGPIAIIDSIFPPLMSLFLGSLLWRVAPRWMIILPIGSLIAEFWENSLVHEMAKTKDGTIGALASNVTQAKFGFIFASLAMIVLMYFFRYRKMKAASLA